MRRFNIDHTIAVTAETIRKRENKPISLKKLNEVGQHAILRRIGYGVQVCQ
jgi:hypothetical protein